MHTIQKDMLTITDGILFHQVNCEGVMGSGIAYALAKKFPGLEEAYQQFCEKNSGGRTPNLLGKAFLFQVSPTLYVANIFGQSFAVRGRSRPTNYEAVATAFESFNDARNSWVPVVRRCYFPYKMGCGLGGGEWSIYEAMIEHYFPSGIICQHN